MRIVTFVFLSPLTILLIVDLLNLFPILIFIKLQIHIGDSETKLLRQNYRNMKYKDANTNNKKFVGVFIVIWNIYGLRSNTEEVLNTTVKVLSFIT